MGNLLPELLADDDTGDDAFADLPGSTLLLISEVRSGRARGMFPTVVEPGPDGIRIPRRDLSGTADAALLARILRQPEFAPFRTMLSAFDRWCAATASPSVAPGVLALTNAELFGPTVCEAFAACATARGADVVTWGEQHLAFLDLFLRRLEYDLRHGWPAASRWHGPVTGLAAMAEETHNGRQRVLRVDLAGGGRVAYKPRPASGEVLFLATGTSVFALLNTLPPVSGEVRLPVLTCWRGESPDAAGYSWQEWVDRSRRWGVLRAEGGQQLRGTVLDPANAARLWHRAGALTAAAVAFGFADLHGGNLLVGGREDTFFYPVDLEIYFAPIRRLADTGLVWDPALGGLHHVGLESTPRWCSLDAPELCWFEDGAGLRLEPPAGPYARQETQSVVGDTAGRCGYGPYVTAMLRGMFDAWTLMCRNRGRIAEFLDRATDGHYVRVVRHPTATYVEALAGCGSASFDDAEREQLRRHDVPYFFRAARGGPLLAMGPRPFSPVIPEPAPNYPWPPLADVRDGAKLTLAGLGVALRDAVAQVYDDLDQDPGGIVDLSDPGRGVRLHLASPQDGAVSFDWPEVGHTITYRWTVDRVRLAIVDEPPVLAVRVRDRLLRLDRVDAVLREQWTTSGFQDPDVGQRLTTLTATGVTWLREVLTEHGWPGWSSVGVAASAAASRLVQHSDDLAFQEHCLELMRAAAQAGELAWREVAYLTDTVLLARGQPQRYGTKFRRVGAVLEPCPLIDPAEVDVRRRSMGLEPLADYTDRIRERFASAETEQP